MATDTPAGSRSWHERDASVPTESPYPPWRRDEPNASLSPGSRRARVRRAAALILFFTLSALFFWLVLWLLRPVPVSLVLFGAGYETDLAVPHNVYGRQTLRDLAGLAHADPSRFLRFDHQEPAALMPGSHWDDDLGRGRPTTVMLVLALHGGADSQGAYLLPEGAGTGEPEADRLRVTAVLERLKRLPEGTNKVLVLDATQVPAAVTLGMLHNDFARALDGLDADIAAVPNLIVLSASDVDQRSWACEEWRQTVFGHYLIDGLRGGADADGNGRISAWELYQHLRDRVSAWAGANRAAAQSPVLLPHGAAGEGRARAITLALTSDRPVPPAEEAAAFAPPAELRAAWDRHHHRLAEIPPPAAYAPHLWRTYQDMLLRYEQLVRAGDDAGATAMATRLAEQDGKIDAARAAVALAASGTASLTMPAAEGRVVHDPDRDTRRRFDDFWAAPEEEWPKRWADWPADARGTFLDLLLQRAAESPGRNLDRAARLARLADGSGPRPAEAHFLIMLARHLPGPPAPGRDELLALALRVRSQAERAALSVAPDAYPYAEQVFFWTEPAIRRADGRRQEGQDLLFATEPADLGRAAALLRQAEADYTGAARDADALRHALATRDRVLAALPYHAAWQAERRPADENSLTRVADLWRDVHALAHALEPPPDEAPDPRVARLKDVGEQAGAVDRQYAALAREFQQEAAPLQFRQLPPDADPRDVWGAIDDALTVPDIDPELRMRILAHLRELSRLLLTEPARPAPLPTADDAEKAAKAVGRQRGDAALAGLGQRAFDELTAAGRPHYEDARHDVATLAARTDWPRALTGVGDEVGARLRGMPARIERLTDAGPDLSPAEVRTSLTAAERLAWLLPGAFVLKDNASPAVASRKARTGELLLTQARRTLEDHWYAEDPEAVPYYRVAGQALLKDRDSLLPGRTTRRDEAANAVTRALANEDEPPLTAREAVVAVTDAGDFRIRCEAHFPATAEAPPGFMALWPDYDRAALRMVSPTTGGRFVLRAAGRPVVDLTLTSPLLAKDEPTEATPGPRPHIVRLNGFYRGRPAAAATTVQLYPLPDVTVRHLPPPPSANMAVRAVRETQQRYGFGDGGVAFVLDCSGSMSAPDGRPASEGRYAQATRALGRVLAKLPRGTRVSVWAFGEAIGVDKRADDVERTVRRVIDPIRWEPDNADQLRDVLTRLGALEPYNQSPLARAILKARDDLLDVTGRKTLVVFSDGADNRFEQDAELNPGGKTSVSDALRAKLDGTGIILDFVGFEARTDEERLAHDVFRGLIAALPAGSAYLTIDRVRELADDLEARLRPPLKGYVAANTGKLFLTGASEAKVDITPTGLGDAWFPGGLTPGEYGLRVRNESHLDDFTGRALLRRGDLLLLDLASRSQKLAFRRALYSDEFPWKPAQATETGDWRLAVLENQRTKPGGLQMLVTLEKPPGDGETVLTLPRPRDAWFELGTPLETAPFAVRWGELAGYPAPAWGVNVPTWPDYAASRTPARPILRAWWDGDDGAAQELPLAPLLAGQTGQVRIDGADVVVTAAIETRSVETGAGRVSRSCVVVRLNHGAGRPVLARLRGPTAEGSEHRLYVEPHRYTGLFWPAPGADVDLSGAKLSLVSLTKLKETARYLEIRDLSPPDPGDRRPNAVSASGEK
jgi:von Willebrand factor type A domain